MVRGLLDQVLHPEVTWTGRTTPVFFLQDAIKFPDVIHAASRSPTGASSLPQAQTAQRQLPGTFVSRMPESAHMLCGSCPTAANPAVVPFHWRAFRGAHFPPIDPRGRSTFVEVLNWRSRAGPAVVVWNERSRSTVPTPTFHRRDLWDAITLSTSRMEARAAVVR